VPLGLEAVVALERIADPFKSYLRPNAKRNCRDPSLARGHAPEVKRSAPFRPDNMAMDMVENGWQNLTD
jgi:hypothetical protein